MALIFNRAHLLENGMVSIILTSQYYKCIPLKFRSSLSSTFIFSVSPKDLGIIEEE